MSAKNKKQKVSQKPVTLINIPTWLVKSPQVSALLFLFSFFLYANTLGHDFTQDDAIVITDNMYTQQGFEGIPGILKKDTFFGFFKEEGKAQLVSGGRYRPLTLIMFAIEYELFGQSAFVGHLLNIIWFGLSVVLLYLVLIGLLKPSYKEGAFLIAFLTAALFAAHPIHTEAVANIKGRDEIMALFFSLLSLGFSLKAIDDKKYIWWIFSLVSFFLGLLAKENTVTFLAIIPTAVWFFREGKMPAAWKGVLLLLIPTVLFLWIRASVIGTLFSAEAPRELMNNPFLKLEGGQYVDFSLSERLTTILFTLGKYVQLLLFPYSLTHDYYPRQIGIGSWTHISVIASLILYLSGTFFMLKGWMQKKMFSFSFFYFIATLSIVSNLVFPVGTNMSERFVYMPSLGFCLLAGYLAYQYVWRPKAYALFWILTLLVLGAYSIKTVDRNRVWENNTTLFLSDVERSPNSAKLQNAAGGESIRMATLEDGELEREQWLTKAEDHLNKAILIHPTYKNAFLLLGNARYYRKDYEGAIQAYQDALRLDPNYRDALSNLGITYRDAGRFYGEQRGDLATALQYLKEAVRYLPEDYETNRLLGVANGIQGNVGEAVLYFEKAAQLLPDNADAWMNLSTAYRSVGQIEKAEEALARARQINPQAGQNK